MVFSGADFFWTWVLEFGYLHEIHEFRQYKLLKPHQVFYCGRTDQTCFLKFLNHILNSEIRGQSNETVVKSPASSSNLKLAKSSLLAVD